jgi:hypothetical protein
VDNPHDLHSWSRHYREEMLQEAQMPHLAKHARVSGERRYGRSRVSLAWAGMLSLACGAGLSK